MKKPWKLRKALALALGVAALTTSCSLLRLQPDVAIKAVPIDLTFGAEVQNQEPLTYPTLRLPEPAVLELPDLPPLKPPVFVEPDLCPLTTAISPRDIAPNEITKDHQPNAGEKYLFRWVGNYDGERERTLVWYREIEDSHPQTTIGDPGFRFVISDAFIQTVEGKPFRIWFEVLTRPEGEETTRFDPGLYLRELQIPTQDLTQRLNFIPAPPLLLARFPFTNGAEVTRSSPDTAFKDPGVPSPLPPLVPAPSENTITSTVTVGGTQIIEVCADLAQAWKMNWTIEITGRYNHTIFGEFWIGAHYGGFPIKDDFIMDGDLVSGNFSSNMMRLDPGDYI